ncbi:hypothetical protein LINGRAHAP2_LOCUS11174, partial [Linum grandiflorum]
SFFYRLLPPSFSYLLLPHLSLQLFFLLKFFSSTSTMTTAAAPPAVAGVARLSLPLRLLQICERLRREHARRSSSSARQGWRRTKDWSCVNGGWVLIMVVTVVG